MVQDVNTRREKNLRSRLPDDDDDDGNNNNNNTYLQISFKD